MSSGTKHKKKEREKYYYRPCGNAMSQSVIFNQLTGRIKLSAIGRQNSGKAEGKLQFEGYDATVVTCPVSILCPPFL